MALKTSRAFAGSAVTWLTCLCCLAAPCEVLAEAAAPVSDEDEGNIIEPILENLSKQWGVQIKAGRFAVNPIKGNVVLRDVTVASEEQGRILSLPRVAVKVNWKTQQIALASVERGNFMFDLSRPMGTEKLPDHKVFGAVRRVRLQAGKAVFRSKGLELVRMEALRAKGSALELGSEAGRLAVRGRVRVTDGKAVFLDGVARAEKLSIKCALEGRRLKIDSFSAALGGGRVSCEGALALGAEQLRDSGEVRCRLESVRLQRGDVLDVVVSGEVKLAKRRGTYRLTGLLRAEGGRLLRPGSWGETKGRGRPPFAVDLTLHVTGPRGKAQARLRGTGTSGRVVVSGNKRTRQRLEELLHQLDADRDAAGSAAAPAQ